MKSISLWTSKGKSILGCKISRMKRKSIIGYENGMQEVASDDVHKWLNFAAKAKS